MPSEGSEINILTPNCLLLGRPVAAQPCIQYATSSYRSRLSHIDEILSDFWKRWSELYAPTMIRQSKWHSVERNLQVGDVVSVVDSNALRGQYYLARVCAVYPSDDGKVRKVGLEYKSFKVGSSMSDYVGAKSVKITRSVHRLALLVPVEEQLHA